MNYIKEMNAFRELLMVTKLAANAIVLWYTLMSINNLTRWKPAFNSPNLITQQLSGLSKTGVHEARTKLVEHGLIKYEPGEKGRAPIYEMHSLVQNSDTYVDQSVNPSTNQSQNASVNEPRTIHKQNKERRKEEGRDSELVTTYQENIAKLSPITKVEFNNWVEVMGEDIMFEAIKLTSKHSGRTFRYLEKILLEWKAAKLITIEEVENYEKNKGVSKDNAIPFVKSRPKLSLFDELREEVSG